MKVRFSLCVLDSKYILIKAVVKVKKYKWWEYPFPNDGGIYKINPTLLGGLCGGLIALLITLFVR